MLAVIVFDRTTKEEVTTVCLDEGTTLDKSFLPKPGQGMFYLDGNTYNKLDQPKLKRFIELVAEQTN